MSGKSNETKKKVVKQVPFMVKATRLGYYADKRRRVGQSFKISGEAVFSKDWMAKVKAGAKVEVTEEPVEAPTSNKSVI